MEIMKRFRDVVADTLGVRFNAGRTDREHNKWGNKHIDHFDLPGGAPGHIVDMQRLPKSNPTYQGVLEAIDKPVYDTTTIVSASTTSQDLFQITQGQSSHTAMETSQKQSGQLPSPEKFTIKRIGLNIQTDTLADIKACMYQILFTFKVNDKIYTQGPLFYYPLGMGIYGCTTANASNVVTSGIPGENGVRSLVYDIPLNPLDPFIGNLTVYGSGSVGARAIGSLTLSATVPIVCVMQGPYERAI